MINLKGNIYVLFFSIPFWFQLIVPDLKSVFYFQMFNAKNISYYDQSKNDSNWFMIFYVYNNCFT